MTLTTREAPASQCTRHGLRRGWAAAVAVAVVLGPLPGSSVQSAFTSSITVSAASVRPCPRPCALRDLEVPAAAVPPRAPVMSAAAVARSPSNWMPRATLALARMHRRTAVKRGAVASARRAVGSQ